MGKFNEYTTKSKPADADTFLVYDTSGKANKQVTMQSVAETAISRMTHNIPRLVPKDITSYYTDGTLWNRIAGTGGYSLYEDLYVGDYFKMSRAISASNPNSTYQLTGSQWVTIASIGGGS